MLMLSELLLFTAHARSPDFLLQRFASSSLSGRQQPSESDKLFWIEEDTESLYATEIVEGQLVTTLIAENVSSIMGLVDYDNDGRRNLLIYQEGVKDADTEQEIYVPLCDLDSVGDVNGDGFEDFANSLEIWLGSPDGFSAGASLYIADDADEISGCYRITPLGDIDGDGRGDFARVTVTNTGSYYPLNLEGTLDLYLGCGYSEPTWTPHWHYDYAQNVPRLSVAADVDGNGDNELVLLSSISWDSGISGEILILDDVLDPLGPTLVVSKNIETGPPISVVNDAGVDLQNVGDIDGDGDDEVLSVMEDFLVVDQIVRILDAEPTYEGLFQIVEPSFDLPLPESFEDADYVYIDHVQAKVGDYNGDGFKDVALMISADAFEYQVGDFEGGAIGIWLTTPPEGAIPPTSPTAPDDMSYCEPPAPPAETDPGEEPKAVACYGCATTHPPRALLLLTLPWLVRRRR